MTTVRTVTDESFAAEVENTPDPRPVLVEFGAPWCPPCRQLRPVLAALAVEEADRLRVVEIDNDTDPAAAIHYGVMAVPTLMLFRAGQPVATWVGGRTKRRLLADLEEHLR
ncbi:thioredoxin family protein [Streptomyces sp. BI20]|uniref:thioredoxin family protein n=1 Tax=Streptomyces sp. BI20 TaxID=3403460 RepID=UPI003C713EC9